MATATSKVKSRKRDPPSSKSSSNGKSNGKSSYIKSYPQPSQKSSLLPSIIVAIAAFLCGVLTPPSLHVLRQSNNNANNITSSSATTTTSPKLTPLPFPLPPHTPCTKHNLANYLHAQPVSGLHVVCVDAMYTDENGESYKLELDGIDITEEILNQIDTLQLTFYKGAHEAPIKRRARIESTGGLQAMKWTEMKKHLAVELDLKPEGRLQQPWVAFTPLGGRIVSERDEVVKDDSNVVGSNKHILASIAASGMIVLTNGGNWVWPPVREGYLRTVEIGSNSDKRNITIETLSLQPLVLSIKGFLSEKECDHIAEKAEPTMQYSGVSLKDADKGKAASEWRTSQSTFLNAQGDNILTEIEHRTASLTRIPRTHQEHVQVLRYGTKEKYDSHHDYFDPASYQSDQGTLNLIEHGKKNRFATVFWYLTDVNDGGHTIFPRAFGLPPVRSHSDCTKGLKVQPQKGKVIIFYSLDASGDMDPLSLHGACPVGENNVKWAANKWIWNAPMGYVT